MPPPPPRRSSSSSSAAMVLLGLMTAAQLATPPVDAAAAPGAFDRSARLLPDSAPTGGAADAGSGDGDPQPPLPDPRPALLASLDLPSGSGLAVVSTWLTARDTLKVKFRQTSGGLPVFGSVLTAEYDLSGSYLGVWSGSVYRQPPPASLTPRVRVQDAYVALARSFSLCPSAVSSARDLSAQVVLLAPPEAAGSSLVLAYLVSFTLDWTPRRPPAAPHAFVDANNLTVIQSWNGLAYQAASPPPPQSPTLAAIAASGGNVGRLGLQSYSLNVLNVDGSTCSYNSATVQVQNLLGATSAIFSPTSFPCTLASSATAALTNGGFSAANDVMRNSQIVVNMYSSYLGVTSPTGSLPVKARVSYGKLYDNAFWDGTYLNCGDGNAPAIFPLTTLDIVGHELGHGFTGSYSGLQHFGQSGAINEAFSDMSGQAAVFFLNQRNSFVVGDNVTKAGAVGVRSMCDPRSDGKSIDSALQFSPSMDIHFSCGVYNKAFCLLAKKPNWDTAKAFSLMAYANAVYWGQLTNFVDGACGVKSAASDLQFNVDDVTSAFAAVNVVCPR